MDLSGYKEWSNPNNYVSEVPGAKHQILLSKILNFRHRTMTLWEDFIRIPKHEENEQYICVLKGREEFRMVSPIYRQNIFVGAMEDMPSNFTPLDFFDEEHTKF